MNFIIAFIFVKFSGQAGKFSSVEDKSPVNSWILQGTKENNISNICPMLHIDHHNTGMDLILQFYEGSSCQSMPPPPRSLRNCVEVGGCDKGITNTEREGPPTMRCPPTGAMQCPCWPAATWRDGMGPTARYLAPLPPPTCDRGITGTASSLSMIGYQMQVYDVQCSKIENHQPLHFFKLHDRTMAMCVKSKHCNIAKEVQTITEIGHHGSQG